MASRRSLVMAPGSSSARVVEITLGDDDDDLDFGDDNDDGGG